MSRNAPEAAPTNTATAMRMCRGFSPTNSFATGGVTTDGWLRRSSSCMLGGIFLPQFSHQPSRISTVETFASQWRHWWVDILDSSVCLAGPTDWALVQRRRDGFHFLTENSPADPA